MSLSRRTRRLGLVVALAGACGLLQAVPALAGTSTELLVSNLSGARLSLDVSLSQSCLEPSLAAGFTGSTVELEPGATYVKELARRDGHGCDGKNGSFSIRPRLGTRALPWQAFVITGDGELGLGPQAKGYNAVGGQVAAPDAFTWTLYMGAPVPEPPVETTTYWLQAFSATAGNDLKAVAVAGTVVLRTGGFTQSKLYDSAYEWVRLCGTGAGGARLEWCTLTSLATGLVLTGSGRSVTLTPRLAGKVDPSQEWRFDGVGTNRIVNRATGLLLTRSGTLLVLAPAPKDFAPGPANWGLRDARKTVKLAKLTIESVKAVKVSDGQDKATAALFTAIETGIQVAISAGFSGTVAKVAGGAVAKAAAKQGASAVAKAGLAGAARQAGTQTAAQVAKDSVRAQIAKFAKDQLKAKITTIDDWADQARKSGAKIDLTGKVKDDSYKVYKEIFGAIADVTSLQGLFNKVYGQSPDQLYVTVGAQRIWPGTSGYRDTKSQQSQAIGIEVLFEAAKPLSIRLWDRDSVSNDDVLANVNWTPGTLLPVRYDNLLVRSLPSDDEDSVYELTYRIEGFPRTPLDPRALVGKYRIADIVYGWDAGEITLSDSTLTWTDGTGARFPLIPGDDGLTLVTGNANPYRRLGSGAKYSEFALSTRDGAPTFRFLDSDYIRFVPPAAAPGCIYRDIGSDREIEVAPGEKFTDSLGWTYKAGANCVLIVMSLPKEPWRR